MLGYCTDWGNTILPPFYLHFISWATSLLLSHATQTSGFFQMWLGNLTGSPSENMVMFPAYHSRFYGEVGIKTSGKSRHPNLLFHILRLLLQLSSLPRHFGCRVWDFFHCFPYITIFSCTCVGACQVPGSVVPRIFTPSWLFVVSSLLSWSPFSPTTLVLHLHGCPLIPSS